MSFHSAVVSLSNVLSTSGLSSTNGDRLFAAISADDNTTFTTLTGWTFITSINVTMDGQILSFFELTGGVTGTLPGSYTFTNGTNSDVVGILFTMSGRATGQTSANTQNNSANTSPFSMAMTGVTAASGDDLVVINFLDSFTGTATFNAATWGGSGSFTARATGNNGGVTSVGISTLDNVAAGATLTITVAQTGGGTAGWGGIVLAFPKASSSVTGTGSAALSSDAASATATETFTGTSSAAESSLAVSATGSVANFNGTASAAEASFGSSATATETFTGTGSAATSPLAATGTATVTVPGTGAAALSPLGSAGTSAETFTGTGSAAAASFGSSATATETFTSTGAAAESPLAVSGTGAVANVNGTGSAAEASFAASSSGTQTATGTGAAAISPFAAGGTGTVTSAITGSAGAALSPFSSTATGAESFTGTGSAAEAPLGASGGAGLPAARVAFTALASHGSGVLTNPWSNSEPRIIKDVGGSGELIGFGWSDKLYIFKSGDNGDTWSFVDPTAGESIGTFRICCATQDSTGKCHITYIDGPGGHFQYARIALAYTSGLVTGFASEVKDLTLPGTYNTNVDVRCTLRAVIDAGGTETLVHCTTTDITAGTFTIVMGKSSIAPAVSTDWVAMDGTAGSTVVFQTNSFNDHDHSSCWAQIGSTKDIWVFWGPTEAEFGGLDGTSTTRIKLTASSHTWSVGSPIVMVGQDSVTIPMALCCYGTANFVWFMYLDPLDGLSFDHVNASGTYTHAVVTSPDNGIDRNGWGVFTVAPDETRIWAAWNTIGAGGPGTADRTREGFWNGASWTLYTEAAPFVGDSWGMGGTVSWSEGLVAVRLNDPTFAISLATIRGGEAAIPITGTGSAALSPLASSATAAETFTGAASAARAPLAATATATETFTGTGGAATSPLGAAASGTEALTSSATAATSPLASIATATETFAGAGSAAEAPFAASATGAESVAGTGSAAAASFASNATATETFTGSASAAEASFGATGAGAQGSGAIGLVTLASIGAAGTGAETMTGTGSAAEASFGSSATATELQNITGTGSAALSPLASSATAAETFTGAASAARAPLAATGTAAEIFTGTVAAALSSIADSGAGTAELLPITGTASADQSPFGAVGTGIGTPIFKPSLFGKNLHVVSSVRRRLRIT